MYPIQPARLTGLSLVLNSSVIEPNSKQPLKKCLRKEYAENPRALPKEKSGRVKLLVKRQQYKQLFSFVLKIPPTYLRPPNLNRPIYRQYTFSKENRIYRFSHIKLKTISYFQFQTFYFHPTKITCFILLQLDQSCEVLAKFLKLKILKKWEKQQILLMGFLQFLQLVSFGNLARGVVRFLFPPFLFFFFLFKFYGVIN